MFCLVDNFCSLKLFEISSIKGKKKWPIPWMGMWQWQLRNAKWKLKYVSEWETNFKTLFFFKMFWFWGHTQCYSALLRALCSEIVPGRFWGPCGMLRIQHMLSTCKANTHCAPVPVLRFLAAMWRMKPKGFFVLGFYAREIPIFIFYF